MTDFSSKLCQNLLPDEYCDGFLMDVSPSRMGRGVMKSTCSLPLIGCDTRIKLILTAINASMTP